MPAISEPPPRPSNAKSAMCSTPQTFPLPSTERSRVRSRPGPGHRATGPRLDLCDSTRSLLRLQGLRGSQPSCRLDELPVAQVAVEVLLVRARCRCGLVRAVLDQRLTENE